MGTQPEIDNLHTIDAKSGGARRDRTADLLHAMQALSQLSYGPTWRRGKLPYGARSVKKTGQKDGQRHRDCRDGRSGTLPWRKSRK